MFSHKRDDRYAVLFFNILELTSGTKNAYCWGQNNLILGQNGPNLKKTTNDFPMKNGAKQINVGAKGSELQILAIRRYLSNRNNTFDLQENAGVLTG